MEGREVDVEVVVVPSIEDHRLKAVTPKNLIGQVRGPECKERDTNWMTYVFVCGSTPLSKQVEKAQ